VAHLLSRRQPRTIAHTPLAGSPPTLSRQALATFRPRETDVYVASYPKSGATLMQMLMYQLTTPGDITFAHIHSRIPHLELGLVRGHGAYLDGLTSPRVFKSHWDWETLTSLRPRGRYIYVIRHPGEVLVSSYHHSVRDMGVGFPLEAFAERYFLDNDAYGSWVRHTVSWWPHRLDDAVLMLRYDAIVRDLRGTASRIASWLGLDCDEAVLTRVSQRCSLSFMREHTHRFDPRTATVLDEPPGFIRRGVSGDWSAHLPYAMRLAVARTIDEAATTVAGAAGDALRDAFPPEARRLL
jgi:hypothetical protein